MRILYKMMELMVCTKSLSAKRRKLLEKAKMTKQAYMNAIKNMGAWFMRANDRPIATDGRQSV